MEQARWPRGRLQEPALAAQGKKELAAAGKTLTSIQIVNHLSALQVLVLKRFLALVVVVLHGSKQRNSKRSKGGQEAENPKTLSHLW